MKRVILTSNLGGSEKIDGVRFPAKLEEGNGQLDLIKSFWKEEAKVLFITASPDDAERNSSTIRCFKDAFPMSGLSVSEIIMCDRDNMAAVNSLSEIDVVILTGGHVPTQNAFFKDLNLREKIRDFDGLVIAWSAGSMNCADNVYAGPELPGEAVDPDFQRWISGLGLTDINIFPHFSDLRYDILDGMRVIEDITFSDSMGHEIIAINNGSYIVCDEDSETIYGEAYRILDGKIEEICSDGKSVRWKSK
ncbi:MAG: Type 1 glutamine amidotransferase-like domain-containing protein [Clostridiales bacterium]|nr:Type 1 glutamine amidotransferase-like domain-containing protein [Clostridiales bacterium]